MEKKYGSNLKLTLPSLIFFIVLLKRKKHNLKELDMVKLQLPIFVHQVFIYLEEVKLGYKWGFRWRGLWILFHCSIRKCNFNRWNWRRRRNNKIHLKFCASSNSWINQECAGLVAIDTFVDLAENLKYGEHS